MGDVVYLDNVTALDIPPERVLTAAAELDLSTVVVIGETPEGKSYFASSTSDATQILWWIEKAKAALMAMD